MATWYLEGPAWSTGAKESQSLAVRALFHAAYPFADSSASLAENSGLADMVPIVVDAAASTGTLRGG
jgi:hypothetical protein